MLQANDWILLEEAPLRVDRSRSTIYRWILEGRVRTIRPKRKLWLFIPDLLQAEKDTTERVRKPRHGV